MPGPSLHGRTPPTPTRTHGNRGGRRTPDRNRESRLALYRSRRHPDLLERYDEVTEHAQPW